MLRFEYRVSGSVTVFLFASCEAALTASSEFASLISKSQTNKSGFGLLFKKMSQVINKTVSTVLNRDL